MESTRVVVALAAACITFIGVGGGVVGLVWKMRSDIQEIVKMVANQTDRKILVSGEARDKLDISFAENMRFRLAEVEKKIELKLDEKAHGFMCDSMMAKLNGKIDAIDNKITMLCSKLKDVK